MRLIDEATDDVVSTEDDPIIRLGLGLRLRCRSCGTEFDADDAPKWIPGGHKKHNAIKCPECGDRVAREKGSNRAFFEDFVGLSVDDAFDRRLRDDDRDPDRFEALTGSEVDPEDVGDSVIAAFEFYPHNGITNWLTIDGDDVFDADSEDVPSIIRGDYPVVEWYEGHYKPIAYPAEWDEDADDPKPKGSTDSYLRFVRRVDE